MERERKERKREKEKKGREKEGENEVDVPTVGSRLSDGRNSLDLKINFLYSTRATFQEVGILYTLIYFHPMGLFVKYENAALF